MKVCGLMNQLSNDGCHISSKTILPNFVQKLDTLPMDRYFNSLNFVIERKKFFTNFSCLQGLVYDGFNENLTVGANYFMTYHTICKTSKDFYSALIEARVLSDSISETLSNASGTSVEVFPYSVFYVFYEQYLTIWTDVLISLSISLAAIFVVTFVLLGLDIHSSLIILITITMILIDMLGLMFWWNITLNAVSLVNLVMVRSNPSKLMNNYLL